MEEMKTEKLKIQEIYENFSIREKADFLTLCRARAANTDDLHPRKRKDGTIFFVHPLRGKMIAVSKTDVVNGIKHLQERLSNIIAVLEQAKNELDFDNPLNLPRQKFVAKFKLNDKDFYIVQAKDKKG